MNLDFESCYRAVASRDARFDGQFFTAVRTTGIYCRPSCPARTPHARNVTFHPTAASAQGAGYRACKRCLPALTPGSPRWNTEADVAARAMRLIDDGLVDREGVPALANRLGYSERQLSRILTEAMGAGPLALARAVRADRARQLIASTSLPITDVAFAAGFASVRQFNDTMRELFGTAPQSMRRGSAAPCQGRLTVRLPLRRPYGTEHMLHFLTSHAAPGLEHVEESRYTRVLSLPRGHGVAEVDLAPANTAGHVDATLALADMRDLGTAIARVRHLLDLDADPEAIDSSLAREPALAPLVRRHPGVRLPGAPDASELLIRTMIGQQISVGAARTHHGRLVTALGAPVHDPAGRVSHAFPSPAAVAESEGVVTGPARRVAAVREAAATLAGSVDLHQGMTKDAAREALLALRGVGPWTADYVAMRLLRDPDTLLRGDLILRRNAEALGLDSTRNAWSPWASYVTVRLMSPVSSAGGQRA